MRQYYQNKLTLQQEQKSIVTLTEGRESQDNIKHLLIKKNILTVPLFGTNLGASKVLHLLEEM